MGVLILLTFLGLSTMGQNKKPNILLIVGDDVGGATSEPTAGV